MALSRKRSLEDEQKEAEPKRKKVTESFDFYQAKYSVYCWYRVASRGLALMRKYFQKLNIMFEMVQSFQVEPTLRCVVSILQGFAT